MQDILKTKKKYQRKEEISGNKPNMIDDKKTVVQWSKIEVKRCLENMEKKGR